MGEGERSGRGRAESGWGRAVELHPLRRRCRHHLCSPHSSHCTGSYTLRLPASSQAYDINGETCAQQVEVFDDAKHPEVCYKAASPDREAQQRFLELGLGPLVNHAPKLLANLRLPLFDELRHLTVKSDVHGITEGK